MFGGEDINLVHKMKKILSKQINNKKKLFMKVNYYRSNLIDMAHGTPTSKYRDAKSKDGTRQSELKLKTGQIQNFNNPYTC